MFVLLGGLLVFFALQYIAPASPKNRPPDPGNSEFKANSGGRAPMDVFHPIGYSVTVADFGKMGDYTQPTPVYTHNGIPTSIEPQGFEFE